MKALLEVLRQNRAGEPVGIYSVCSAHPLVLRAALVHARASGQHALIEATSNQVNQEGGYTGLRPAAFRDVLFGMADEVGLARERIVLGGDHLGPNTWRGLPVEAALQRAGVMVAEYVSAGFRKIHLDCSMSLQGDPQALPPQLIAERAAALCAQAEHAWESSGGPAPVYVIGSEVPVPGGAQETLHELAATEPDVALEGIAQHRAAFAHHGLEAAWERVIAVVVQPGVEFDQDRIVEYQPAKARRLSGCLAAVPRMVFEAHSTDYQSAESLAALVRDHFAILKVGPALTFALREAVWALDQIEREWLGEAHSSHVREALLAAMRSDPTHWRKYYQGSGRTLELQLAYSLSDRIRYSWPAAAVTQALRHLEASFHAGTPPLPLLRQYLPAAYAAVRRGELQPSAQNLIVHHVRQVLSDYSQACGPRTPAAAEDTGARQ
ncbi:MAG: D-tagatose-bisphosphate aldolase, class II, non-catalytic subunit [Gammaproteobacteria bacterium]|nr:D-tagatose-bisphosphate aldolase, class II, non-catalytic subunit [Gammaproteobacteria bacterium]MBV8308520.1 D-tagatose-bisphosphate aldolase, class II, non-catalytic subunit [Gammaproteobacteria bacterium]